MSVPIVSFVGSSGSGKTTLLEKVIRELVKRGYAVGVIKHDAHGFEIDHEGKDSWRHKHAGAGAVILCSPKKFAVIKDTRKAPDPSAIINSLLSDSDVVLTEGFKRHSFPKIEVLRKANSKKPVCLNDPNLLAMATDADIRTRKRLLRIDDFKGVVDLIEKDVIKKHKTRDVSLMVDGRIVPLKPFIEGMLKEALLGMTRSLKGCAKAKEIELRVKKR
ncbi:MAG: molybdopterin-guanine dinucleotide biosynthesis protein B [Deltaproteobacteria bacterium]